MLNPLQTLPRTAAELERDIDIPEPRVINDEPQDVDRWDMRDHNDQEQWRA